MDQLLQAQELRIQQLEAQNTADAAARESERTTMINDFRAELNNLRTQVGQEAAAAASASRAPGLSMESRLVDTRVIGKPDMYYGEREKWKDWSMILKAYMMAVDPAYVDSFERLEHDVTPMPNAAMSPRSTKLSVQLYYVLVMLSRAKAQDKLNVVGQGEGYIAWQRFLADYDPKIRTRRVGMLIQILTATFSGDLAQALDQFDRLIKEYEQCCEDEVTCPACQHKWRKPFDEQLKAGLVVANMGDSDIQAHLLKNFTRLDSFEKIREEVLELTRATQYLQSQARPMELGAFPKGKHPGKKGGGKGKDGGKSEKMCHYCNKPGHFKADCRKRVADEGAASRGGQPPAGAKTDGKTCNFCKKSGHVEAECKKKKRDQKQKKKLAATAEAEEEVKPIGALQMTEMQMRERVPHGFLLPLALAEAKSVALENAMEELVDHLLEDDAEPRLLAPLRAMVDTGAGASVFPRRFSKNSVQDKTRKAITLTTATSEEIVINDGRRSNYCMPCGSKVQIRHHDSDKVTVPVISVSETAAEGNWTIFGPGTQKLLGPDASQQIQHMLSHVDSVDMVKSRGVYWLDLKEEHTPSDLGWPLCAGEVRPARQTVCPEVDPRESESTPGAASSDAPPPGYAAAQAAPGTVDSRPPALMPDSEAPPKVKAKKIPAQVTLAEWNDHQMLHLPFRSWCPHCIAGKAKEDPHRRQGEEDPSGVCKWCANYFFLGRADDKGRAHPVLNNLDARSGATFPGLVEKGGAEYAIALTLEGMRYTGRTDLLLMTDQENAVGAVAKMVAERRSPLQTQLINSPVGSSKSAGLIERSNYEVEAQFRAMKSRVEHCYGISLTMDHKLVPWAIRHAGWLLTNFLIKTDGKTPHERLRGRPYRGEIAEFAETVHNKLAIDTIGKADDRWSVGIWVGKTLRADEHLVGTSGGVKTCRSIWRRPEGKRFDKNALDRMVGSPWDPVPSTVREVKPRSVYITYDRIKKMWMFPTAQDAKM